MEDAESDDRSASPVGGPGDPGFAAGARLRRLRVRHGLSLRELSRLTHYSKGYLSKIETSEKPLTVDVARRCDEVLETGGVLTALARDEPEGRARKTALATDQPSAVGPPLRQAVTHTLPRHAAAFTGREDELRRLLSAAEDAAASVAIWTIDGMPGVGKSALAVRAAHLLAPAFPDGRLFVELHGHSPGLRPADPADVLAGLLASTGMAPGDIPSGLGARAARWRDRLAGRKVLLVLDDAADRDQVEPLLPGAAGCMVMITSRRRLVALDGAVPVSLEILPPASAVELFARLAHRGPLTDAESSAVADLVARCGHLPLAIALLAGRLAHHPAWSVADFAAGCTAELGELAVGDRGVAAAFEMSYSALPPERQRLFRCLGLHPGADIDAYAAAALTGRSVQRVRADLEAMYTDHLLDEPVYGRYRPHDLLREYARTLTARDDPAEDRARSAARLLDYYEHTARIAGGLLIRFARNASPDVVAAPAAAPALPDRAAALTWMRTEQANLLACLAHATALGRHRRVVSLTSALAPWLLLDGPWEQAAVLHRAACAVAGDCGDPAAQATALQDLARVCYMLGEYGEARAVEEHALALVRRLGDRFGEATALQILARLDILDGDPASAADALERQLDIVGELGHRPGEASALQDLARVRAMTGEYAEAERLQARALASYRDLGDSLGEATALFELGRLRRMTAQHAAATQLLEHVLHLYRNLGDPLGQANCLQELGRLHHRSGDHHRAAELLEQALGWYRDAGDVHGEAEALNSRAALLADTVGPSQALPGHREALTLARRARIRMEEARALEGIARCLAVRGERAGALTALAEAVTLYRRIGTPEAGRAADLLKELTASR
ncbi:ATP-binding protein [Nonomuraea wenchangensis]|uniref:ATP-binding protein n=1 Tax=Nonomuraea wenchangensis TaxID=568860 RepID=UPI0033322249